MYSVPGTPSELQYSLTDANSHTTTYTYDGFDRPKRTTYPDSSTEGATYDANNNPLTRVTRAGAVMTMSYDSRNRLSRKAVPANSNAAAVTYSYAYDYSNRVLSVEASTDSAAYTYGSDTAGRQLSETRPDGKEVSWTLDADGNRSQLNGGWTDGYATSYSYDALNRLTDIY